MSDGVKKNGPSRLPGESGGAEGSLEGAQEGSEKGEAGPERAAGNPEDGQGAPEQPEEKEPPKKKKKQKKKGSTRGVETMFRTNYRTHLDLSSLADNKANIMISINGIIISILLASIYPRILDNRLLLLPTAVLLLFCLLSLV